MDHLQIPMEANDASWRERCNRRMEGLKNSQISISQPTTGVLQKQLYFEEKLMISELCTSVQNKDADRFVDKLEEISAKRKLSLANILDQVTHTGDCLLHMAAHFGAEEIGELIAYHFPQLLMKRNMKGDTPLHVAARAKNPNVVKMILSQDAAVKAKLPSISKRVNSLENEDNELTRLKNEHGNTALHEAVYTNLFETVSHLFQADKAVARHLNKSDKSALYIAVVNSNKQILDLLLTGFFVDELLPKNHGISPLHAAISEENSDMLDDILKTKLELIYLRDEYGGTPLHYAASTNYLAGIRILLKKCSPLALECNTKGHLPIHIACKMGHVKVVKELLKQMPNVRYLPNQKGQNILHVAAKSGKEKVVKYLLEEARLEKFTINEKDRNGNTALHLATEKFYPNVLVHLVQDRRVDFNIKNNDDFTAFDLIFLQWTMPNTMPIVFRELLVYDILLWIGSRPSEKARSIHRRSQRKASPKVDRINTLTGTLMLVAILIATVTFAAGFTVPGGVYSSDDPNPQRRGLAVFANKAEFQMFMVCNTIAMFASAIGCLILMRVQFFDRDQIALLFYMLGDALMTIAVLAMFLAFVAAARLIVSNVSWLANSIIVIAIIFSLPIFVLMILELFVRIFPMFARKIPQLQRCVCPQFRHVYYFIFKRIYIPFHGEFAHVKITKKREDTDPKRVNMDEDKDKEEY